MRWREMLDTVVQALRHGLRRLAKKPRFTVVTMLILALGIGATSTLFTVVHSVLLSPLPFEEPEELVFAWETRQDGSAISPVSPLNFTEWRAAGAGFLNMAAVRQWPHNVTGGDVPERVTGAQVSSGLLSLFGVVPFVGREFTPEEEHPGADRVCLVSHGFWLRRLGGSRDLTSLRLVLNGESHAVVGVLPDGFTIPGFGPRPILTPLPLDTDDPGFWSNHNAQVFGRLEDDVPLERAGRELGAIAARLQTTYPDWNDGIEARVVSARDQIVQGSRQAIWILFGSVAFVLLIACANIASLFLARCAEAEREMAVRTALGAHRSRIIRLVLSEAVILGAAGGLLGLWLCLFGVDAIRRWAPSGMPRVAEVSVSLPVLVFVLAASVGTGLLFGLLPALRASKVNVQHMLKEGGRALGTGGMHRIQRALVVSEVAVTDALPEVFIDQRQDMDVAREFYVVAHTRLPAATLTEPMREAVRDVDPDQPVAWVQTLNSTYSAMVAQPRFTALLVAAFGFSGDFSTARGARSERRAFDGRAAVDLGCSESTSKASIFNA